MGTTKPAAAPAEEESRLEESEESDSPMHDGWGRASRMPDREAFLFSLRAIDGAGQALRDRRKRNRTDKASGGDEEEGRERYLQSQLVRWLREKNDLLRLIHRAYLLQHK